MSHRYLVLGLLAERPMTGYDIKKHVEVTLSAVTNASYGTLYPTLHRLRAEGAVEMEEVPQKGRPARKVYSITEQGRAELRQWLREPPAVDQVRREFLLKLYFARDLTEDELRALLASRRQRTENRLQSLQAEREEATTDHHLWIMDYALALCRAEMAWLTDLEAKIGAA